MVGANNSMLNAQCIVSYCLEGVAWIVSSQNAWKIQFKTCQNMSKYYQEAERKMLCCNHHLYNCSTHPLWHLALTHLTHPHNLKTHFHPHKEGDTRSCVGLVAPTLTIIYGALVNQIIEAYRSNQKHVIVTMLGLL